MPRVIEKMFGTMLVLTFLVFNASAAEAQEVPNGTWRGNHENNQDITYGNIEDNSGNSYVAWIVAGAACCVLIPAAILRKSRKSK